MLIYNESQKIKSYQAWAVKQIYGVNHIFRYLVFIFGLPLPGKYFRFRALLKNLKYEVIRSKKILDAGSGLGEISILLGQNNHLTSIDSNQEFLNVQKSYALIKKLEVSTLNYDLNHIINFKEVHKFDIVIALSVIDYIRDPMNFLMYLTKNLNKGGKLVISYPKLNRKVAKSILNQTFLSSIHKGFDETMLNNFFISNDLFLVSEKHYMPFNLFYLHNNISQKLVNFRFLNMSMTVFSFFIIIFVSRIFFFLPPRFHSEIFQIWKKYE